MARVPRAWLLSADVVCDKLASSIPAPSLESAIATNPSPPRIIRFGVFEVDLTAGEVRKAGLRQKLVGQPFQLLQALLERPGEIVTRDELRQRIWPENTFVDYELALKKAVNRLREVLGDSAESPRFIETIPRRGYRFIGSIAPFTTSETGEHQPSVAEASEPPKSSTRYTARLFKRLIAGFALLAIAAIVLWLNADKLRTRIFATSRSAQIHSVAVLPLENLSKDPEQEYFADGMTDELITDLAKVSKIQVISHTSVERYKGTKRPLPEIARELGVQAVVEGRVMRSGDRVRITAQLIEAATDRHLWADSYERSLSDVLALQAEVAHRIAAEIGVKLTVGEQTPIAANGAIQPAAYEAYLKGIFYWSRSNCEGSSKGLEYFQQAVARDSSFAPAHVGLAQSYFTLGDWGCRPQDEVFPKSRAAALKAAELDPSLGSAHAWLGTLASFYDWDWTTAENELRQAIDLDPNYAVAHVSYAVFLIDMGRRDQSFFEMRRAHDLDPTSELTNMAAVHVFYLGREYDRAIEQARAALELHPESSGTYYWLGASYERKGMYQQAADAWLKSKALVNEGHEELDAFRNAYLKSGIRGYWQQELARAKSNGSTCALPTIYADLNEKDRTLEYLNKGFQQHCTGLRMLNADPVYDNLRDDPRFQALLRRMNFPN